MHFQTSVIYIFFFFKNVLQYNNDRTQSSTWLWDDNYPALQKIAKRFDHVTRLQISNPEITFESDEENQTPISHREIETSEAWQVNFD